MKYIIIVLCFFSLSSSAQNVGIGNNLPLSKLHVSGTIRSDTLIYIGPGVRSLFAAPNGRIYDSLVVPSTINWEINGNSNITPLQFLGTTNTQDLIFKTNNVERMRTLASNGNIGIGTATPNNSSLLQLVSTSKGLIVSQMTTAQRIAIVAPANGLIVDDLTAGVLMRFNGIRWLELGSDPIGTIQAFNKSMALTPVLPWGWVECNGQVLVDSESPYNGQVIADLNNTGKFLRGSLTSGTMQNEDFLSHTHTGTTAIGGSHDHTGSTSTAGNHNHTGNTGSVSFNNGRFLPWDDNLSSNELNGATALGNTPSLGLPWNGLAKVGNMLSTISDIDHGHVISTDGNHSHTIPIDGNHTHALTTNAAGGIETRPTNMSVVWIMRIK